MKGGRVGWRNGLDTEEKAWRTVEIVWTQNGRLVGLQKWYGHKTGDWVGSRYGLDKG
jgi:hypothetical protein